MSKLRIVGYTTYGSVRDGCGHRHRNYDTAHKCYDRDSDGCASQGGYSDRSVCRIGSDGYLYYDDELTELVGTSTTGRALTARDFGIHISQVEG